MTKQYDLIIIGSGEAATTVASKCRAAGWAVAVIDYRPFGGTCALRGCDPKKVLVGGAEIIDWVHRMEGKGIVEEDLRIDWRELMTFKRSFTDPVPPRREKGFAKQGIDAFHGRARFRSPRSIEIEGEVLEAKHFIIAAGDAAAMGPPLTPVAVHDGYTVASNLLKGNQRKPDYRGVPSVVFTIPPLASVGLQEEAARKQGLKFRVQHSKTSNWYTARRVNEGYAGFKVLIEEDSDRILGAHLIGPHAEEVINLFALAIRSELRAKDLKTMIWAYPTAASDIPYML